MSAANTTFTAVMKSVADALKLDGDSKVNEAYMKYLECVLRICTKLLQDARLGGSLHLNIGKESVKMVKLGQQCMDRVAAIVSQTGSKMPPADSQKPILPGRPSGTKSEPTTPSEICPSSKPKLIKESFQIPKDQSPLEQAYKQNQQMMMAYKARLARMDPKRRMATSLTIQRKMAENLAIAKVQEEALKKKMQERQQRLEEQAVRRFGTPTGLTDDDKEQRLIYKKVLEYEQEHNEFGETRKQMDEKPCDPELINQLLQKIFSSKDHPLMEKIADHQKKLTSKLQHLVGEKMKIVEQIKVPLAKTLYPKSSSDAENSGNDRDNVSPDKKNSEDICCTDDQKQDEQSESDTNCDKNEENEANSEGKGSSGSMDKMNEENEDSDGSTGSVGVIEANKGDVWVPDFGSNNLEDVESEIKSDLEKAIEMGQDQKEKLKPSIQQAKGILHQVSQEYDQYNQDNMDELFDDDNSENDDNGDETMDSKLTDQEKSETTDRKLNIQEKSETVEQLSAVSSLSDLRAVEMKIKNLKNEAYQRHVKGIAEDIHHYSEKMLVLFTVCYEQLDCIEGKDQCYVLLEESTFRPIWTYLLWLYRLANEPKELSLAYVMTEKASCQPVDCSVSAKLQLCNLDAPYDSVVRHLKTLPEQQTLLSKLECLVKCSRLVCNCITEYYEDQNVPAVGADDLLPILSYVIIKTGLPQLLSECAILEEFIHEGYIMGEEGYCLTSIETAIGYLVSQGMT